VLERRLLLLPLLLLQVSAPLVDAYLARRALDYMVGFNLSPLLWRRLGRSARSAGEDALLLLLVLHCCCCLAAAAAAAVDEVGPQRTVGRCGCLVAALLLLLPPCCCCCRCCCCWCWCCWDLH
jgi:hypothetical protein